MAISLEGQEVNTSKPLLQAAKTIRAALAFTLEVLASDSEDHIGIKSGSKVPAAPPSKTAERQSEMRLALLALRAATRAPGNPLLPALPHR